MEELEPLTNKREVAFPAVTAMRNIRRMLRLQNRGMCCVVRILASDSHNRTGEGGEEKAPAENPEEEAEEEKLKEKQKEARDAVCFLRFCVSSPSSPLIFSPRFVLLCVLFWISGVSGATNINGTQSDANSQLLTALYLFHSDKLKDAQKLATKVIDWIVLNWIHFDMCFLVVHR